MLRLFVEEERERPCVRGAGAVPVRRPMYIPGGSRGRAALDLLALGSAAEAAVALRVRAVPRELRRVRREESQLVGYLPRAGGAACAACAPAETVPLARGLPRDPRSPAEPARGRPWPRARGSARCVTRSRSSSLPTSSTGLSRPSDPDRVKRDLGSGYELDDDPERIDREEVHRYLSEES